MALKKASKFLLVLLTAWSLCGIAAVLETDALPAPSQLLVSTAQAGDPDALDGTERPNSQVEEESDGFISAILNWIEDVIDEVLN